MGPTFGSSRLAWVAGSAGRLTNNTISLGGMLAQKTYLLRRPSRRRPWRDATRRDRNSDHASIIPLFARDVWYVSRAIDFSRREVLLPSPRTPDSPLVTAVECPNCHSSDVRRVSLIHAAGVYESRGRVRGWLAGVADGLLFGSYKGTNQSRLSKLVRPPTKFPYATPAILWLVGFFPLIAFVGRGKLSFVMGLVSVAYVLLLPALVVSAFVYNLFVYPKKYRAWDGAFMCQRCGTLINTQGSPQSGQ
jgi:hypothetical protein